MDLLKYFTDDFITFTVHRKTFTTDSDGIQTETLTQIGTSVGDLQPVSVRNASLRRNETGLNITESHVLYTQYAVILINDEIHVDDMVFQVVDVINLKDFIEVHLELRE